MRVLDPGHLYRLETLDGDGETELLRFVKREGPGYPRNVGHYPGTNLQEVLRVLIDRVKYLDGQEPHSANTAVLSLLRGSIRFLEERAALRHTRPIPIFDCDIEFMPTCRRCGHIGCTGECVPTRERVEGSA